jgi:hypothetical protein
MKIFFFSSKYYSKAKATRNFSFFVCFRVKLHQGAYYTVVRFVKEIAKSKS